MRTYQPVSTPVPAATDAEVAALRAAAADGDPEWRERALCAQTDPEAFFPEKGEPTRDAKRICGRCEVRAECLDFAVREDIRFGIWGGLSARERRRLQRGEQLSPHALANAA